MNVLFLSELFYPHGGGAELATYLYAKSLSDLEISVKVITNRFMDETEKSQNRKLEIFRLPLFKDASALKYSMLANVNALFSGFLRSMIRWADVVYVPLFWYSAIPLAKAYGRPVVTHFHNYVLTCPLGTLYDYSKNRICPNRNRFLCRPGCVIAHERASGRKSVETMLSTVLNSVCGTWVGRVATLSDAMVCVSKTQRQLMMNGWPKAFREKLHVIYNPLPDLPSIDVGGDAFGYFGGPSYLKGFAALYCAVNKISRESNMRAQIYATKFQHGSMPNADRLTRLGFILHGKLDDSEYKKVYRQIRCVLVPSVWQEPLPYVVTEALLRRRIVIASNVGGIPEIVEGCNGVLMFEAGKCDQLAEKMMYVKDLNDEAVTELGSKNRQNVLKKFNNERTVQRFVDLLDKVVCG